MLLSSQWLWAPNAIASATELAPGCDTREVQLALYTPLDPSLEIGISSRPNTRERKYTSEQGFHNLSLVQSAVCADIPMMSEKK